MVEGGYLLPPERSVACLAFSAHSVVVIVRMTAYAGLGEAAIRLPAAGPDFLQQRFVDDLLERVAGIALGAGMLADAGEARHGMVEGLFVEGWDSPLPALMFSVAGNTLLAGNPEMVSRFCIDGALDIGVAWEALGTGYDFWSFMTLHAIVHAAQMLVGGWEFSRRELGLRQRLCKENKQRRCETLMQVFPSNDPGYCCHHANPENIR
jgi:hypothetical protein